MNDELRETRERLRNLHYKGGGTWVEPNGNCLDEFDVNDLRGVLASNDLAEHPADVTTTPNPRETIGEQVSVKRQLLVDSMELLGKACRGDKITPHQFAHQELLIENALGLTEPIQGIKEADEALADQPATSAMPPLLSPWWERAAKKCADVTSWAERAAIIQREHDESIRDADTTAEESQAMSDRHLIVFDGEKWFVRHVRLIEHDLYLDEKVYRCDEPLGGPYGTIADVPEVQELIQSQGRAT